MGRCHERINDSITVDIISQHYTLAMTWLPVYPNDTANLRIFIIDSGYVFSS